MYLMCLNICVYCVFVIGYDGFVFCNLVIIFCNYNLRFNLNELYIVKGKKIKLVYYFFEFLNYL